MQLGFATLGLARLSSRLPSDHSREFIANGNLGTAQTIRRMADLVSQGKRDFRVRKKLKDIISRCSPKDYFCYAKAAHEFCRDQIRYVFDPNGVELIEAPYQILESGVADCDSIVVLMATLCEQMGFRCEFVTVQADASRPKEFTHVYVQVSVPGRGWVGSDPTMPDKPFGWRPGADMPIKTWPASNDPPEPHGDPNMLGMDVPGVQKSPGVMVGPKWNWRNEVSLVTATPEAMELAPFKGPSPMEPDHGSFYVVHNAPMSPLSGFNAADESAIVAVNEMDRLDAKSKAWMGAAVALGVLFLVMKK